MSEQNSSHVLAESLSALMDNQASELELQRVLKASELDLAVKNTWSRDQLVGAVLRGETDAVALPKMALPDFAAKVSAAIAEEEAQFEESLKSANKPIQQGQVLVSSGGQAAQAHTSWRYQLGRMAMVASVAGLVIMASQQFTGTQPLVDSRVATINSTAPVTEQPLVTLPSGINSPVINTRTVAAQTGYETRPQESRRVMFQPLQPNSGGTDEEVTRYVNQMIRAHSDNAAMNSGQGVLPYARVVITDEE